jgi:AmiR/NasT family two-component response regulator
MYSEARKMHLIEDLLKVKNDAVLIEIESVLKKAAENQQTSPSSAHDLVGVWSKEDAEAIEKAIEEGCEQIHPDDWK